MRTKIAKEYGSGALDNVQLLSGDGTRWLSGGPGIPDFDRVFTSAPDVHVGEAVSDWVHTACTPCRHAVLLWEHYQLPDRDLRVHTRRGSCAMVGSGERRRFVSVHRCM